MRKHRSLQDTPLIAHILLLLHIKIKLLRQNKTLLLTEDPKLGQVADAPHGWAARDLNPWKTEQAGTLWKGTSFPETLPRKMTGYKKQFVFSRSLLF